MATPLFQNYDPKNSFANLLRPFSSLVKPLATPLATPAPKIPFSPMQPKPVTPNMSVAPTPAPNMSTINGPRYSPAPIMTPRVSSPAPATPARPSVPIAPVQQPGNVTTPSGAVVNPATGALVTPPPTATAASPAVPVLPQPSTTGTPPVTVSSTPAAPVPIVPDTFYNDVKTAETAYQSNLAPTAEEQAAQEELDKLEESYKTGFLNTANQAIPMEFITGQQKALESRKLALAEPLSAKLARLQAKRTSAIEASKFALERADKRAEPTKIGEGESYGRFNPATGKMETVYQGTPKAQSMSEKYGTGAVGEYNFYADQERQAGRAPMSFNDYQTLDANRKAKALGVGGAGGSALAKAVAANPSLFGTLTPTAKTALIPELAAMGIDTNSLTLPNVSGEQREKLDAYDTLDREAKYAKEILDAGLDTGIIAGPVGMAQSKLGFNAPFTNYNSALSNMNSILLKARSGAAVTPQEYERIKGFIPLATDDQATAKTKIERFFSELEAAKSNYITRITQTPQQIAGFGGQGGGAGDPLGLFK